MLNIFHKFLETVLFDLRSTLVEFLQKNIYFLPLLDVFCSESFFPKMIFAVHVANEMKLWVSYLHGKDSSG